MPLGRVRFELLSHNCVCASKRAHMRVGLCAFILHSVISAALEDVYACVCEDV